MIIPIAPVIGPVEDGTVKLILNISSPVIDMFTVLLLVPAIIVTVCVVKLKSLFIPEVVAIHSKTCNYIM